MKQLRSIMMLLCLIAAGATAQTYKQVNDISYTKKTDAYSLERLKLDVYYPEDIKDCPVMVWFHGGGLEAGSKEIPRRLKNKGYVVVGVNYPETNARGSLPLARLCRFASEEPLPKGGGHKEDESILFWVCARLFVPLVVLTYSYLWLRRRYFHSKMKRKVNFPFAFCSFNRTFALFGCLFVTLA